MLQRRQGVRATLDAISTICNAISAAGEHCVVVLAGDFNAIREEFVLGNGAAFFDSTSTGNSAGAAAVRPAFRRPAFGGAFMLSGLLFDLSVTC